MSDGKTKIRPNIPLDSKGKHVGYLTVPHSRDDSAWGALRVPIAVVKGGSGPSVLLTGANHGDEFEGPLALLDLIGTLEPGPMRGRVVILPALNYPALKAGRRLSPIDGGNMNRSFPGAADGTITQQIAHYVQTELLPGVDAVLDIHAGGRTLMFMPFAAVHQLEDGAQMTRAAAALEAFGAPVGLVLEELDAEGMLDTAVERMGKVFVSTELGGGGSTTPMTVALARRGALNLLRHWEALEGAIERPAEPSRLMRTDGASYTICEADGLIEYLVDLGQAVRAGEAICRLHDIDRPLAAPALYRAGRDGVLVGRCHGGRVVPGDFLALVAFDA